MFQKRKLFSALTVLAAPLALSAAPVQAAQIDDFARVISATPQMARYNRPVEECHTEYVQTQQEVRRNNPGGAVLGALVGGALGNQVGGGSGRAAATAAGVIGGAVVGDRLSSGGTQAVVVGQQPVRQCRMVDRWEERPNGYAVTYEYNGRTYNDVLPYDPGRRLRVAVSVTPVLNRDR